MNLLPDSPDHNDNIIYYSLNNLKENFPTHIEIGNDEYKDLLCFKDTDGCIEGGFFENATGDGYEKIFEFRTFLRENEIRHIWFGDERVSGAGYIFYPNISKICIALKKLESLFEMGDYEETY